MANESTVEEIKKKDKQPGIKPQRHKEHKEMKKRSKRVKATVKR
jgi:hypothetical protein